MQSTSQGSRIEIVQALRGIAALGVLLWHTTMFTGEYGEGIGGMLFLSASTMGVDLFFVICGFVMVISSVRPDGRVVTIQDFFIRRFARIYPLYVIATLAIFALENWGPQQTVARLLRSLVFFPGVGQGMPAITSPTLVVGWTIIYEIQFYFAFGISLVLGKNYWMGLVGWFIAVLLIPALLAGTAIFDPYWPVVGLPANLQIFINPLNWLFACGIVIALIYRSQLRIENVVIARALQYAVIIAAVAQYAAQFRVGHGIFNAGLTVVPLVLVLTLTSKTSNPRPLKMLTDLGRISFSLYMLHPCAIWIYIYGKNALDIDNPWGGWFAVICIAALSVALANISFHYIESGFSEHLRRLLTRNGYGTSARKRPDPVYS